MAKPIPCDAAVVFADRRAQAGLRDRLKTGRRIRGASADLLVGRLKVADVERSLVVAAPVRGAPLDCERLVAGLLAAHSPRWLIGAGSAIPTKLAEPWTRLVASEVRRSGSPSVAVVSAAVGVDAVRVGEFQQLEATESVSDNGVTATNTWCHDLAATCQRWQAPVAVVAVAEPQPDEPRSNERRNVQRQSTLAGTAGAVLRLLARRPSEIATVWREQEAAWEGQERLADLVTDVLARCPAPSGAEATRRA